MIMLAKVVADFISGTPADTASPIPVEHNIVAQTITNMITNRANDSRKLVIQYEIRTKMKGYISEKGNSLNSLDMKYADK